MRLVANGSPVGPTTCRWWPRRGWYFLRRPVLQLLGSDRNGWLISPHPGCGHPPAWVLGTSTPRAEANQSAPARRATANLGLVLTSYSGSHTVLLARLENSDRPLDRYGVGAYSRLPFRCCSRVGSRSCL